MEYRAQIKPEEDLRAEHQNPALVERNLELLVGFCRRTAGCGDHCTAQRSAARQETGMCLNPPLDHPIHNMAVQTGMVQRSSIENTMQRGTSIPLEKFPAMVDRLTRPERN